VRENAMLAVHLGRPQLKALTNHDQHGPDERTIRLPHPINMQWFTAACNIGFQRHVLLCGQYFFFSETVQGVYGRDTLEN